MNNIEGNDVPVGCGPLLDRGQTAPLSLRQQVFQHVRSSGRAARAEITRALGISAGSATTITADLIASGILTEVSTPSREPGRGRPPVALEVVGEAGYAIGIKLSFKRHSAVLCDFSGNVIATASNSASDKRRSTADLLAEISGLIERVFDSSEFSINDVGAVGIGLPGIVDKDSGLVRWSSLLTDTNVDLVEAFADRFSVPLFVDNDTNMLTLAELWFGVGRSKDDFAVVTIENGVGMGLVVGNQLYRGTHGMGLELGHTKVQLDGALCRCGQRGCLEAYLGDYALSREAATALDCDGSGPNDQDALLELLFEQAKSGHSAAEVIFQRAARYLAVGLSNVVQLFDPPIIILSGKRTRYDYLYADEMLSEMQKMTLSEGRSACEVEVHFWDDLDWARGATVPALTAMTDKLVGGQEMQNQ